MVGWRRIHDDDATPEPAASFFPVTDQGDVPPYEPGQQDGTFPVYAAESGDDAIPTLEAANSMETAPFYDAAPTYDAVPTLEAVSGYDSGPQFGVEPLFPSGPTTELIDPRVELESTEIETIQTGLIDKEDRPRRSGRNLVAAALVGTGLLAVVVGGAWYHPMALTVVVYLAAIGAIIEWRRALAPHSRHLPLVPTLAATVGMALATWNGLAEGLAVALLIGCVGVVAWRVADERIENTLADSLASMLTLLWIPFLLSFFVLMVMAEGGWVRVLIVVLAISGNDTGGLFAGMAFGRHQMSPRISPKKTWEGLAGGVLLGTGVAAAASFYLLDGRWWIGAIAGAVACGAAVVGDLAESVVKRDLEIKDMSGFLPGHGGIMDRIDSALFAAPAAYLAFAVMLGTT